MSYGGPHYGFMAARNEHIRRLPGRIVGETHDLARPARVRAHAADARAAHPAREGHVEHHDQPDAPGAGGARLPVLARPGGPGRHRAGLPVARGGRQAPVVGLPQAFDRPTFKEFALDLGRPAEAVVKAARAQGVHPGYALGRDYPGMENLLLVAVTEKRTRADIDAAGGGAGGVKLVYERSRPGRRRRARARDGRGARRRSRRAAAGQAAAAAGDGRAGARAPLHRALDPHVRDRHGLLSARLVHDEVQPARERARGGARRVPRPAPPSGRRRRAGRARADVAAGARCWPRWSGSTP